MSEDLRVPCLDHGYCQLVESWGSDERIIESARMSTNKGFQGWGGKCGCADSLNFGEPQPDCSVCGGTGRVVGDEKLLRYLYEHKHSTPFEMAGLTIEVKAPIFVFRQWHRHRTASYNEMSARYTPLPDENYQPRVDRCVTVDSANKQARSSTGRTPTHDEIILWLESLSRSYNEAERVYRRGLELGVPKELARLPVPVARYSAMRASANLRNWLAFLTLRLDPHAQYEIRVYAEAVGAFIAEKFPRTWELFAEGGGRAGHR